MDVVVVKCYISEEWLGLRCTVHTAISLVATATDSYRLVRESGEAAGYGVKAFGSRLLKLSTAVR